MARARLLKPGFFKNELLAKLKPLERMLFAGLWTLADREGRLEDRPERIKAEILPYDRCNVDQMLKELDKSRFIKRYEVNGQRLICIPTWKKHQTPHIKEAASTIPAPCEHSADTVHVPEKHGASPSLTLNPYTEAVIHTSSTSVEVAPVSAPLNGHVGSESSLFLAVNPPAATPSEAWFGTQHERWWPHYWNRVGKQESIKAFKKRVRILALKEKISYNQAVDFLINQAVKDKQRWESEHDWEWRSKLHPATWLNNERWTDELPPISPGKGPLAKDLETVDYPAFKRQST